MGHGDGLPNDTMFIIHLLISNLVYYLHYHQQI